MNKRLEEMAKKYLLEFRAVEYPHYMDHRQVEAFGAFKAGYLACKSDADRILVDALKAVLKCDVEEIEQYVNEALDAWKGLMK